MSGPVIECIELTPLHVPFRAGVRETMAASAGGLGMAIPAEEPWLGGDFVIAQVHATDGSIGLGEAFVWLPETGVSPRELIAQIENGLARFALGESPFQVGRLRQRLDANMARCDVAKGLLDIACYDLMGRITGRSAADFMGGRHCERLPLCALIPLMAPESMVSLALGFERAGSRSFRLKLGRGINEDVAIVEAVRGALQPGARLRVDYNQAYTPEDAVRAIEAVAPFGIDVAEQPVAAEDWPGLARVQRAVDVPLMAHEGCFSLREQVALVDLGAVRVVGVNTERPGGVTAALRAIDFARQRGLSVVLHNQPLGIASAVQIHLAAARFPWLGHDMELFGHVMLEDDLILEPLDTSGASAAVPDGPGLGVELDRDALARYATGETLRIERSG